MKVDRTQLDTIDSVSFNEGSVGTKFGFSVADSNDDYTLSSVTVAEVPEPTSLLSFLAVGAFGVGSNIKRKLKQKA